MVKIVKKDKYQWANYIMELEPEARRELIEGFKLQINMKEKYGDKSPPLGVSLVSLKAQLKFTEDLGDEIYILK